MKNINIVLIHTHDTGRYISPYGYNAKTNNIQRIANKGSVYRNFFTAAPTCSPSRSSLMTGLYPHQNGMYGLAHRGSRLHDYSLHLSNYLKNKDFETALFGIQHEIDKKKVNELGYNKTFCTTTTDSVKISSTASKWIKKYNSKKPFFISIGYFDTHREYVKKISENFNPNWIRPPELFLDNKQMREDMAKFYSSLEKIDRGIGKIYDTLKEKKKLNNTLILLTTDHGIAWPGMKCNLNDHGTGIFLIAYLKNVFEGGVVYDDLTSNIDIFPTICKILDIKKPKYLNPYILPNKKYKTKKRKYVYSEVNIHTSVEPCRSIRSKRFRLLKRLNNRKKLNLSNIDESVSKSFLLKHGLKKMRKNKEEFFDLFLDPLERNPIKDYKRLKSYKELNKDLKKFMENTNDPLLKKNFKWPKEIQLTPENAENPEIIINCQD